jgi:hypothetical protein
VQGGTFKPIGGRGGVKPPFFMRTRNGIFNNIMESDYEYSVGPLTFYFSSPTYRQKFMDRWYDEMLRFNDAATRIYKELYNLDFIELALIRLYMKIEKRGFYIKVRGETVTWPENLTFRLVTSADRN